MRGFFVTNRISRVHVTSGAVTHNDLNPGYHPTNFTLLNRTNALAQPTAIAFESEWCRLLRRCVRQRPRGAGGRRQRQRERAHRTLPDAVGSAADPRNKRGPRGLALNPGAALYVLNRLANTISIVNWQSNTVANEIPIGSHDPTTPTIRQGRGFLYDAKLSGNGTVSCASCHVDAEMDLLAWDLGDPTGQMATNQVSLGLVSGLKPFIP